jgi:hypothetical protein
MAWFVDLSPLDGDDRFRAVGWLERGKPFPTGPVDPTVFKALIELVKDPWQPAISMGFHFCDLCQFEGQAFGNRNLCIPATGFLFLCPELIVHYMNAHWYRPPDEFCAAALACPPMRSMAYLKALLANGGRELLRDHEVGAWDSAG